MTDLDRYRYGGARALILLHERFLREFLDTWRQANSAGLTLPETSDPSYASMEELLLHVLGAARSYMVWICEKLELPDPQIELPPARGTVEEGAEAYLEHLVERWRLPLVDVTEEDSDRTFLSRWNVVYSIDAMLEHAVMHPIRHAFQLRRLMEER